MSDGWRCKRCGADRWVAASLSGPDYDGSRSIRQCVPCGHYSTDPVMQKDREAGDGS